MAKIFKVLAIITFVCSLLFFRMYLVGALRTGSILFLISIVLLGSIIALMFYFIGEIMERISMADRRLEKIIKPYKKKIE